MMKLAKGGNLHQHTSDTSMAYSDESSAVAGTLSQLILQSKAGSHD